MATTRREPTTLVTAQPDDTITSVLQRVLEAEKQSRVALAQQPNRMGMWHLNEVPREEPFPFHIDDPNDAADDEGDDRADGEQQANDAGRDGEQEEGIERGAAERGDDDAEDDDDDDDGAELARRLHAALSTLPPNERPTFVLTGDRNDLPEAIRRFIGPISDADREMLRRLEASLPLPRTTTATVNAAAAAPARDPRLPPFAAVAPRRRRAQASGVPSLVQLATSAVALAVPRYYDELQWLPSLRAVGLLAQMHQDSFEHCHLAVYLFSLCTNWSFLANVTQVKAHRRVLAKCLQHLRDANTSRLRYTARVESLPEMPAGLPRLPFAPCVSERAPPGYIHFTLAEEIGGAVARCVSNYVGSVESGSTSFASLEEANQALNVVRDIAAVFEDLLWSPEAVLVLNQALRLLELISKRCTDPEHPGRFGCSTQQLFHMRYRSRYELEMRLGRSYELHCQFRESAEAFQSAAETAHAAHQEGIFICTALLTSRLATLYFALSRYRDSFPLCLRALREVQAITGDRSFEILQDEEEPAVEQTVFLEAIPLIKRPDGSANVMPPRLRSSQKPIAQVAAEIIHSVISSGMLIAPTENEMPQLQLSPVELIEIFRYASRIHVAKRHFGLARTYIEKALKIADAHFAPSHPIAATVFADFGYLLLNIDEVGQAVAVLRHCLSLQRRVYGDQSLHVAAADLELGYSLYVQNYTNGAFASAEQHVSRSLAIRKLMLPTDHVLQAFAQRVLGLIKEEMGIDVSDEFEPGRRQLLLDESKQLQTAGLGSCLEVFGEESLITAKYYGNLGRLFQTLKQPADSEIMHLQAIAIKERVMGVNDFEVALSVGHLASLYNYDVGLYEAAEELYLRSISIGIHLYGESYSGLEFDYMGLIHVYEHLGNAERVAWYNNTLDKWDRLRLDNHPARADDYDPTLDHEDDDASWIDEAS
ncbi:hypothetical protein CAOG_00949 [Capsaspora owczarzaki ATCC 30864]|uniref:Uncharacterized protein n=1 Tax=Capsaspora owczarzaki (strain ATCC 30864) TaxID=595528 RepID=A0A0D2WJE8_CAPO3|nr:hypothetical protein CAOG_00949 [Capsaspora owczarzaki ATCC 30864]KJE89488.1 hypothetical protein CAOG_000949 [Capsaspora owczarzaki ATCC 30864]|eukprot:XP_004365820.2 hypothetical protein CAOG_00949 [Capsaspora owczarzaki ATCC 30864]